MKQYEKRSLARFFGLFFGAFMLMFLLLSALYYLQEHRRLSKEMELTNQMSYIECMKLGMEGCSIDEQGEPVMEEVYADIAKALGLVLLLFVPISLWLSFFALRPVHHASTMIDNFIANIVHDINTPISTIMLNAKSLLKRATTHQKKIQRILSSAKQLTDMQHDLLALADENREIAQEAIEIKSTVEEIVEEFRLQYPTQPFELNLTPHTLTLNPVDFRRIIQNLLSNAIKYNQQENPIRIYTQSNKLVIHDQGKGMAHPKRVFEKNYREDYSIQGNGLGLASVMAMLDRNNMEINVESQLGVGTRIELDCGH